MWFCHTDDEGNIFHSSQQQMIQGVGKCVNLESSVFKSCVARAAFLAQYQAEIDEAVKGLPGSWPDLQQAHGKT